MAKNITFNGANYSIDEAVFSAALSELKSHLSTFMSGTGAVINLDGASYNIDQEKLVSAKNDFVSHLRTIYGNGSKVVVGGVEYSVDSAKIGDTLSKLDAVFGKLGNVGQDSAPIVHNGTIPEGGVYYTNFNRCDVCTMAWHFPEYLDAHFECPMVDDGCHPRDENHTIPRPDKYVAGDTFPALGPDDSAVYKYGDYIYYYNCENYPGYFMGDDRTEGWEVMINAEVVDIENATSLGEILTTINGINIVQVPNYVLPDGLLPAAAIPSTVKYFGD